MFMKIFKTFLLLMLSLSFSFVRCDFTTDLKVEAGGYGAKPTIIQNLKAVPVTIQGYTGNGGGLCKWNDAQNKWICSASRTLATRETGILFTGAPVSDFARSGAWRNYQSSWSRPWIEYGQSKQMIPFDAGGQIVLYDASTSGGGLGYFSVDIPSV